MAHATFVIARDYEASPARVFRALSVLEEKKKWFSGPEGWDTLEHTLDFRVGGRERERGGPKGGPVHSFDALYMDIVPDERIVFGYWMKLDDTPISASLTTIELRVRAGGTHLVFTEQDAFLDGFDDAGGREQGTKDLLDALGRALTERKITA